MTHTRGPWKVMTLTDSGLPAVVAHDGPVIADVSKWTSVAVSDPDGILSNARLIAAAPELLEACKLALNLIRLAEDGTGWTAGTEGFGIIKQAIAKAERRQEMAK